MQSDAVHTGNSPRYPRVLLISHNPLSEHTNNGKTLLSLFRDWPGGSLAQLYVSEEAPGKVEGVRYFRIRDRDIVRRLVGLPWAAGPVAAGETAPGLAAWRLSPWFRVLKTPAAALARDTAWRAAGWYSETMRAWLEGVRPEVVFFVGSDCTFTYDIALRIAKEYDSRLVLYCTDDYFGARFSLDPAFWIQRWRLRRRFDTVLRRASNAFVIGEIMAEEYARRYQRSFQPVMHVSDARAAASPAQDVGEHLTLMYMGNIGIGRWRVLGELARASQTLGEEGINTQLNIYSLATPTEKVRKRLHRPPYAFFRGAITDPVHLRQLAQSADVLVHVESFSRRDRITTRLSISTKIADYLTLGSVILAIGPGDVASIRFLQRHDAALVCTHRHEIVPALRRLATDEVLRTKVRDAALVTASTLNRGPSVKEVLLKCCQS